MGTRCANITAVERYAECSVRARCGGQPADIHDSGVLVLWGEGAAIAEADGARILPAGGRSWTILQPGVILQAGDLLYAPLNATIVFKKQNVTFGAKKFDFETFDGIRGQMIAVTGPSAGKLAEIRTEEGALSAAELRGAVEKGSLESLAPTKADWSRIIAYGALPEGLPSPSREEIEKINKNFDALHFPPGRGVTPEGRDLADLKPPVIGEKPPPEKPAQPAAAPTKEEFPWWILAIVILVALPLLLMRSRK